ncbi:hypothetical protein CTA2_6276 [Colletotrichum tanaceti]|uniref:Uncharacterized protein n=1 Tax=Colletotrichum tanaceti TaxID=1306861 RepID=A0A4U6XIG8_9PEZI|nr:hypothetical protein CTA2_6276 [Colletotrichum tanaceti]TKW55259.1 hypothetical protein CTA1_3324 [Colletotrichum tanaceti]
MSDNPELANWSGIWLDVLATFSGLLSAAIPSAGLDTISAEFWPVFDGTHKIYDLAIYMVPFPPSHLRILRWPVLCMERRCIMKPFQQPCICAWGLSLRASI